MKNQLGDCENPEYTLSGCNWDLGTGKKQTLYLKVYTIQGIRVTPKTLHLSLVCFEICTYREVDTVQAEEYWILYRIRASYGRISTEKMRKPTSKHWPFTTRGLSRLTHIYSPRLIVNHKREIIRQLKASMANKPSKTVSSDVTNRLLYRWKVLAGSSRPLGEKGPTILSQY